MTIFSRFPTNYLQTPILIFMILTMSSCSIITKAIYQSNFTDFIALTILSTFSLVPTIFLRCDIEELMKTKSKMFSIVYSQIVVFDVVRTFLSYLILFLMNSSVYILFRMQLELFGSVIWK